MITPDALLTHTLKSIPDGYSVARILAAAINSVSPDTAVRRFIRHEGERLFLRTSGAETAGEREYDLSRYHRIRIFGLGKASAAMGEAASILLQDKTPQGLLVLKHLAANLPERFEQVVGGHPVPSQGSLLAGETLRTFLSGSSEDDLLICLISGGGSALLASPLAPVTLQELQELTKVLLSSGARIDEINTLRRHLDALKGGGLANLASPSQVISLILSDVVGSPLEAIASGPTAPDPTTREDALGILRKYKLEGQVPGNILEVLRTAPETPKKDSALFNNVQNVIIGDNFLAATAALQQAKKEGFNTFLLGNDLQGEARATGRELCKQLRSALRDGKPVEAPFCLVAGGETTVTLHGQGHGGRNQELALAAASELANLPGSLLVSLATDGEDGPTDAAGAVVDPITWQRGQEAGLDGQSYLDANDSYSYFSELGDLLKIGPTGTNVNDLTFLFGFK